MKKTKYQEICEKYNLQRIFLKEIIKQYSYGFNKKEIALQIGLSRLTVGKYIKKLKKMDNKEIKEIWAFALRGVE